MGDRSQDITLRQLRYLVALGSGGGFRKGADLAGISQPAFSAQIKLLETNLNVKVAERGNGSFAMTPLGRELISSAVDILDRVDGLVRMTESGPLTGVLRLGVKATLGPYLLPGVVRHLHQTHPSLRLFIREGPPVDLERELTDGLHDVVLAQLPLGSGDVQSVRLFREGLYLAVAADHPFAGRETFEPADLAGLDVLTLSPRYHLHDQVLRLCEENGARLRRDYEGTSLDALRQMVGMGLGVTFLPALYVGSEVRDTGDVAVLKPKRVQLARSVGLAWRNGSSLVEAYGAIGEAVRQVLGEGTFGITPET